MLQMRIGNKAVQVFKPFVILRKQNNVECTALAFHALMRYAIHQRQPFDPLRAHACAKRAKQCTHCFGRARRAAFRRWKPRRRARGRKGCVLQRAEQIMR